MNIQGNQDTYLKKNHSSVIFLIIEILLVAFLLTIWSSVMRDAEFVGYFFLGGVMALFGIIGLIIGIRNLVKKQSAATSTILIIASLLLIFGLGLVDRLARRLNPDTAQERQQRFYKQSLQERYNTLPNEGLPY